MPTSKPCTKARSGRDRAITSATTMKITSQKKGSKVAEIMNTVAKAIARPNKDNPKISFQFILLLHISLQQIPYRYLSMEAMRKTLLSLPFWVWLLALAILELQINRHAP